MNRKRIKAGIKTGIAMLAVAILFTACGRTRTETVDVSSAVADFPAPDLMGYAGLSGYDKPLQFVEMTVRDADALLKEEKTFVLLMSFANCPWCNAAIPYLNDVALEWDATIAMIDTRKDPSWQSNLDLLDYDLFVEDFGDHLEDDEDGIPHLYVPHVFFIKNGKVVYEYQGALPEMGDDAKMELNDSQKDAFRELYRLGFRALQKEENT